MTTSYHTPIPSSPKQEAKASLFNSRFATLDAGIVAAIASAQLANSELADARSGYISLDARLDGMVLAGGNVATLTNGSASAGQKVITVDSTTGFLAGALIAYTLAGGDIETNVISSITPTTTITCVTNIGSGGIANDTFVMMIPLGSLLGTGVVDGATAQVQTFNEGVFIGTNSPSTDDSGLLIGRAAVNPLGSGGSHGVRDESTYYYAGGGYASFDAIPVVGGAGAMGHLVSFQARPDYEGVGTLSDLYGFDFQPTVNGPVSTAAGVTILNPLGSGTIAFLAGLYVKTLSRGSANYAIFIETNTSHLGGGATFGGSTPISVFSAKIVGSTTNGFGLHVTNPSTDTGGTITNLYGLYIDTLTFGGSANYAIYVEGANTTYLGGPLQHAGATVGFYGVAPTTRQLLATGTGKTVDDVITALQTLGLVKQS